jgi:hypothetical protein
MGYAVENALYQWREGERRLRDAEGGSSQALERAADAVVEELHRRLGSRFTIGELADLYATDTDWATRVADRHRAGTDAVAAVDAAFNRYAREASDFAGGRARQRTPPT